MNRRHAALSLLGIVLSSQIWLAGFNPATPQDLAKQEQKATVDEQAIRALIAQLGDDEFDIRESAQKRLVEIGELALPLLEKSANAGKDPEVRNRSKQVIVAINRSFVALVRSYRGAVVADNPWTNRIAVTPDGRLAVASSFNALRCWDIESGKEAMSFDWPASTGYSWALCISPDVSKVLVGSNDRIVRLMDFKTGKLIRQFTGHTDILRGVAFVQDGKTILTASWDKSIRQWDIETGKQIRAFEQVPDAVRCMAVSPDGKVIACGHFDYEISDVATVRLWNFETGKETRSMKGHKREITNVAFTPDGKTLLSCGMDGLIFLWDVASGKLQKTLQGHRARVLNAAFTPDGKRVVSCGDEVDKTLRIWDVETGKELLQSVEFTEGFTCAAVLPDGRRCVTTSHDGFVRLWEWKR